MPGGFDLNAVDICVEFVDEGDCSQSMVCIDVPPHVVRSIVGCEMWNCMRPWLSSSIITDFSADPFGLSGPRLFRDARSEFEYSLG